MIQTIQLFFTPFKTWQQIALAQRNILYVLILAVIPVLALAVGLEGYSLLRWGEQAGELGHVSRVSQSLAVRYAGAQFLLAIANIFFLALLLHLIATSFNLRSTYRQSFTLFAYAYGGVALGRLLDAAPFLPTWVCWVTGALASTSVLYHGVGLVLKPEQTKGFSLYMVSVILLLFTGALIHFLGIAVLQERIGAGL